MPNDIIEQYVRLKVLYKFAILDEDSNHAAELKKVIDKIHDLVNKVSNEKARYIMKEYLNGVSMQDIADKMSLARNTVYAYKCKYLKEVEQQIKDSLVNV